MHVRDVYYSDDTHTHTHTHTTHTHTHNTTNLLTIMNFSEGNKKDWTMQLNDAITQGSVHDMEFCYRGLN